MDEIQNLLTQEVLSDYTISDVGVGLEMALNILKKCGGE